MRYIAIVSGPIDTGGGEPNASIPGARRIIKDVAKYYWEQLNYPACNWFDSG